MYRGFGWCSYSGGTCHRHAKRVTTLRTPKYVQVIAIFAVKNKIAYIF